MMNIICWPSRDAPPNTYERNETIFQLRVMFFVNLFRSFLRIYCPSVRQASRHQCMPERFVSKAYAIPLTWS